MNSGRKRNYGLKLLCLKVIQVDHLSKKYRRGALGGALGSGAGSEFWALQDISMSVAKGESLGVIGRNGAGKSTLLKILSRITAPTEGSIRIKGKLASLLEVGTGFHQDLTGRENIYLNGAILGMSRKEIRKKFDQIVGFSGVEPFIDTPVKRYSSGMYVRLAFSVAAHLEAEILLMDEVLAVGDSEFQKRCHGKMDEVTKEGRTILFVSHNLEAVNALCQRTLLLDEGRMSLLAPTPEVVERYLKGKEDDRESIAFTEKGQSVDLLNISLLDKFGRPAHYFSPYEEPKVRLVIRVNRPEPSAVVGFGLTNRFERRVFTDERPLSSLTEVSGTYQIEISIPTDHLVPGRYGLVFAVHIPNQMVLAELEENMSLYIHHTDSNQYRYSSDEGSLRFMNDWSVTQL